MDEVHQEFVDLIAQLDMADDAQLPALLQTMEVHLQQRFSQEDGWMNSTAFSPRDCPIDEHAAMLKSVAEVREKLAQGV